MLAKAAGITLESPLRRAFVLTIVVLAGLAVAPAAFGSSAARSVAIHLQPQGAGSFEAASRVPRFTLAGVTWRGPGTVEFRTGSVAGGWSAWRAATPEDEDGPDPGSVEQRRAGWHLGNPFWVGVSDRIEARATGNVSSVRAELVWSPDVKIPLRVTAAVGAPPIVPRLSWGADEKIRRGPPSYASEVRFAIVHHTAGRNDYSRSEAAAIVKGIELYHVESNGWNDIGYNFLVDRFGTIYEGRYGGVDRNVIGAHALGFNTGSVGIALLGTYGTTKPSQAALDAIAKLVAWRLDRAHVDPTSFVNVISGGSEKYAPGVPVLLGAVSGHRDTGLTECPGNALYARLNAIASAARAVGGLKIFDPEAAITGTSIRVRARLSAGQAWTVTVTSAAGAEVARGDGAGTNVDWTWESAGTPAGSYTWTVNAGSARPAAGTLRAGGGTAPLAIETAAAEPEAISPNDDGQADTAALTYRINAAANVSVEVTDQLGGVVATIVDRVWTRAGEHAVTIDGAPLADGEYNVVVTARTASGLSVQKVISLSVNRTLGLVAVAPASFSPNGDGRKDTLTVRYALTAPAFVRIRIEREGRWVASPLAGTFVPVAPDFLWNGMRATGRVRDGTYDAVVEVTSATGGVISYGVPFVSDTVAPRVRILPGKGLRVEVSEPSLLTFVIDGRALRREVKKAGTVRIPWSGPAGRVRVVAWDAAGNVSGPVARIRRD